MQDKEERQDLEEDLEVFEETQLQENVAPESEPEEETKSKKGKKKKKKDKKRKKEKKGKKGKKEKKK